ARRPSACLAPARYGQRNSTTATVSGSGTCTSPDALGRLSEPEAGAGSVSDGDGSTVADASGSCFRLLRGGRAMILAFVHRLTSIPAHSIIPRTYGPGVSDRRPSCPWFAPSQRPHDSHLPPTSMLVPPDDVVASAPVGLLPAALALAQRSLSAG